ncbi:hypothetical protein EYF80_022371 [Liparis tanakae]|uniref:Uncharacterized protein n=1 Tax=Liparis tanakae TaxID=230148 RepID=A0A4Z2HNI0_9TELE|nr:hypothetical protein EYF80_022371 [Liparis tanakae]
MFTTVDPAGFRTVLQLVSGVQSEGKLYEWLSMVVAFRQAILGMERVYKLNETFAMSLFFLLKVVPLSREAYKRPMKREEHINYQAAVQLLRDVIRGGSSFRAEPDRRSRSGAQPGIREEAETEHLVPRY